jgi:hypothetical protein
VTVEKEVLKIKLYLFTPRESGGTTPLILDHGSGG